MLLSFLILLLIQKILQILKINNKKNTQNELRIDNFGFLKIYLYIYKKLNKYDRDMENNRRLSKLSNI